MSVRCPQCFASWSFTHAEKPCSACGALLPGEPTTSDRVASIRRDFARGYSSVKDVEALIVALDECERLRADDADLAGTIRAYLVAADAHDYARDEDDAAMSPALRRAAERAEMDRAAARVALDAKLAGRA